MTYTKSIGNIISLYIEEILSEMKLPDVFCHFQLLRISYLYSVLNMLAIRSITFIFVYECLVIFESIY